MINGSGSLTVASAVKNAVHCTGALKVSGATLCLNAYKHALRGNYAVVLINASISAITNTGDGIQTDNENDDPDKDTSTSKTASSISPPATTAYRRLRSCTY